MAWEWSHASEAYTDAYENLHKQPREWLNTCLAEWHQAKLREYGGYEFNLRRYDKSLAWCAALPADIVVDSIWEKAEELRLCDNGGWNAWMCPFGCHTVPFSCEEA